jgi:hypothetical protein
MKFPPKDPGILKDQKAYGVRVRVREERRDGEISQRKWRKGVDD